MLHQNFKYYLPFLLVLSILSCAKRAKPVDLVFVPVANTSEEKLDRKKDKELMLRIDSLYKLRPKYFKSKIDTEYEDTTQSFDFRTSIKMVTDSATFAMIKKGPIPLAAALVRNDSVLISNKIQSCAIRKDLEYLKNQFGYEFSLSNLEELILGLPIGFDTTQRYYRFNDKNNYIIATNKKRELRRELKGKDPLFANDKDTTDEDNVSIRYFLSSDLNSIDRVIIDSPDDNTHIYIDYLGRELVNGYLIPTKVKLYIQLPRNVLNIIMNYTDSEVNVPVEISFSIAEDEEACGKK